LFLGGPCYKTKKKILVGEGEISRQGRPGESWGGGGKGGKINYLCNLTELI